MRRCSPDVDEVKSVARCTSSDTMFPASCKVLQTLSIKDLVASPAVLLNAAVSDLMAATKRPLPRTSSRSSPRRSASRSPT